MVPIVATPIDGEKVSIYDPSNDPTHALNGFRLRNSTGLHLSGGPVTVFQGGVYAGDAQVNHIQPGEQRFLSYAVDLDLVTGHENPRFRQETLTLTAKSGILSIVRKQQRENTYTLRNKSAAEKTVLIEQTREPEFKLTEPAKPEEQTADKLRFKVNVAAKGNASLKVVTERPVTETVALIDLDANTITAYSQSGQASQLLRAPLKELLGIRRRIADLQGQRAALEAEIQAISADQTRIRQNMMQLDRNSALYQQYVKKLTDQETRLERVREQITKLKQDEALAQKEQRDFLERLTLD